MEPNGGGRGEKKRVGVVLKKIKVKKEERGEAFVHREERV